MAEISKGNVGSAPGDKATLPARSIGVGLGLERTANVIQISMTCRDEYAAIVLYDQLVSGAQQGRLSFSAASKTEG